MEAQSTRLRRWTRAEYARLIEAGIFRAGEPVELLGEHLMVGEPQDSAHYTAIGLVEERSPGRARTRLAGPLAGTARARRRLGAGARRRADARRPAGLPRRASSRPALVIAVAESSLALDASTREASTRGRASPTTGS